MWYIVMKNLYKLACLFEELSVKEELKVFAKKNNIALTKEGLLKVYNSLKKTAEVLTDAKQQEQNELLKTVLKIQMNKLISQFPEVKNHPDLKTLAIEALAATFTRKPLEKVVKEFLLKHPIVEEMVPEEMSFSSISNPQPEEPAHKVIEFKSLAD